jgi:hypothetical protein
MGFCRSCCPRMRVSAQPVEILIDGRWRCRAVLAGGRSRLAPGRRVSPASFLPQQADHEEGHEREAEQAHYSPRPHGGPPALLQTIRVAQSGGNRIDVDQEPVWPGNVAEAARAFPPTRQEIVNQISTCGPYREESVYAWGLIGPPMRLRKNAETVSVSSRSGTAPAFAHGRIFGTENRILPASRARRASLRNAPGAGRSGKQCPPLSSS